MFMPSKRRLRSRANSRKSIGFLSGRALLVSSPGYQRDFVKNSQGLRLLPSSRQGSVTFGGAPGKRNIPGIGTSVRPKLADLAKPDRIVVVNEEKLLKPVDLLFEIIIYLLGEAPEQSWPL